MLEIVRQTSASCGILIILHDLNLAARFSDKVYLMHRGKIVESGSPAQVLTERTISDVYGVPVSVMKDPLTIKYY